MWQFFFADDAGGDEARVAASILADGLRRQGYDCTLREESITVSGVGETDEHCLLLLQESLIEHPVIRAGLDQRSTVVVCSARPASLLLERLNGRPANLVAVDAAGIAFEEGADQVTALLGGAARVAPWIDPDVLSAAVWASYDREFGYGARAALRALDKGFLQAQEALRTPRTAY